MDSDGGNEQLKAQLFTAVSLISLLLLMKAKASHRVLLQQVYLKCDAPETKVVRSHLKVSCNSVLVCLCRCYSRCGLLSASTLRSSWWKPSLRPFDPPAPTSRL